MYALGASLHVKFQSGILEFLFYRTDKRLYVGVSRTLRGVEIVLYHVVGIMLEIFERDVLQFAFQSVETQLVGYRCIEIACLLSHLVACLLVVAVAYEPHQVHPVGYHDEDHPHVFREGDEQITEVFGLYGGSLLVKFAHLVQSLSDVCHLFAELLLYVLCHIVARRHTAVEQYGQHRLQSQVHLVHRYVGSLQSQHDGVEAEDIAVQFAALYHVVQILCDFVFILLLETVAQRGAQSAHKFPCFADFFIRENEFFFHNNHFTPQRYKKTSNYFPVL